MTVEDDIVAARANVRVMLRRELYQLAKSANDGLTYAARVCLLTDTIKAIDYVSERRGDLDSP